MFNEDFDFKADSLKEEFIKDLSDRLKDMFGLSDMEVLDFDRNNIKIRGVKALEKEREEKKEKKEDMVKEVNDSHPLYKGNPSMEWIMELQSSMENEAMNINSMISTLERSSDVNKIKMLKNAISHIEEAYMECLRVFKQLN